ncbi:MAG: accessory factor UbiK family protein [Cryobacterium sp.]|uniref:accessory factor UbiK family protein n=1 Tax=unclassified Chelatococcus TaxID=2638111 RepID=UPI001BCB6CDA|nr:MULTISPECIES: accessory factor UbiK family protein [unclassified Chelatococcus]MBX3088822.1 accessory factor UbiK family protein [Cryobacterium sp.]CAH1665066.1 BMFP domain-containing protein YqiC [Hyphomicrobiales bacterium]MBS7737668.1 accessory factor UbiK family protein [Chelatococcus sp. HY11]MBX3536351.1 accessory factor UbiK family protein [Chelatococcus sp.]MBX3544198.1 accessory factor UbiK family protein [Chelatococcus sp.]
MTQTTGRFFDDVARLFTDAAGVADGARREAEAIMRAQIERLLRNMDVVSREEFEAVRQMALIAREENEKLEARIAALETRLSDAADPAKT